MNISQLKTFVAVVEHGSFSEAGRALGISQPAVTMQIQALESDIGATLLDRGYRKVELTEAGRVLLPRAQEVIRELEAARDSIDSLSDTVSGRLTIAASTTPGQYLLPRLLGRFRKINPAVGVTLRVYDSAEVVDRVEAGEADLGMTGAEVPGAKVAYEPHGTDELVLIAPADHPLAAGAPVRMTDLTSQPFIVREPGSGTRIAAEEAIRRAGVDPAELDVVMELGTNEAIVSAVEGGMGLGIVSRLVADKALKLGTVSLVSDAEFPLCRPLFLVLPRRTLTRASAAFVAFLRAEL